MADLKKGPRGLPAIARAREERARRGSRWTMQAGLVAAGAIVAGLVMHTIVNDREISNDKHSLLARQLAIRDTVGAEWFALRDRIQGDVAIAAKPYPGDRVEPEAATGAFRTQPGLYLRARLAEVVGGKDFEQLSLQSKKDGFAACLLRERNDRLARGDLDAGAFSEQPWNVGQAYESTEILNDAWVASVQEATEPLRLRLLNDQLEEAVRSEIPLAAEIVRRARFFLLVLDEADEGSGEGDGGVTGEDALQLVDHPARVFLFDLRSGALILRLRRSADANVIPAGERVIADPEIHDAMQRQANNCSLAAVVQGSLGVAPGAP